MSSAGKLCADDLKLYTEIQTSDDYETLQRGFSCLERWSLARQINEKCAILHAGR